MQAAVMLVALALAYVVYVVRAGLGRRIQLDWIRLRGLFGRGPSRLSAVNACLYWIFFINHAGAAGQRWPASISASTPATT